MDGPFTLISSNIRFDNPEDGPHAWPNRRVGLAALLSGHAPAVIATQEGRRPQLVELASLQSGHELVADHRAWIPERMYPSLFVRRDLTVQASGDIWLSETPEVAGSQSFGSAFPRLCTWARVRTSGPTLMCVSAHLDHVQEDTRRQQAVVMVRELAKVLAPDDHLVVMGDFNEGPEGETRAELLGGLLQLTDPWTERGMSEEVSHHRFGAPLEHGARIDWVLLDRRLVVSELFFDKACPGGVWPSDHYPLVCRLSL